MGRKLLVADDSVTIQKVIKLALSSEGYDILAVSDGKEAIRAIQEERPDVVLIDVTLPGADAYAVKRIINANPKLAGTNFILMLSAFERVDEKAIEEVTFQGRLIKPFDPSHLRKAVAELVNKPAAASVAAPAATSMPPLMPALEPTVAPAPPTESLHEDDMPPVQDMHPTVQDESSSAKVTEEEFQLDAPGEATRTSLSIASLTPASEITPPPPPSPMGEEERTDPNFTLPDEAVGNRALENDIKNLTESTIKMSGLDEWSLDDSAKMKDVSPATKPPAAVAPPPPPLAVAPPLRDDSTREMTPPGMDKKAAIMKNLMSPPQRPLDDGGSSFPLGTLQAGMTPSKPKVVTPVAMAGSTPPPATTRPAPPAAMAPPAPAPAPKLTVPSPDYVEPKFQTPPAGAPSITRAEIEQLIRKDIEAAIEKIAREAVPRIAEAIIRKEIERILAEP